MYSKTNKVLIALSSPLLRMTIEQLLKKNAKARLRIQSLSDVYTLGETLRSEQPDLVITSTDVVGDVMLPILKERTGTYDTRFVAFCMECGNDLRNFDALLSLWNSHTDIVDVVERILDLGDVPEARQDAEVLTPREKDIVVCVAKGLTSKEIARELSLSTHTVITHRRNIAKKLDLHTASSLVFYAVQKKLVSVSEVPLLLAK